MKPVGFLVTDVGNVAMSSEATVQREGTHHSIMRAQAKSNTLDSSIGRVGICKANKVNNTLSCQYKLSESKHATELQS